MKKSTNPATAPLPRLTTRNRTFSAPLQGPLSVFVKATGFHLPRTALRRGWIRQGGY